MTKALNAASEAIAAHEDCSYGEAACAALRAALPAEPAAEVIEAMALAGAKTLGMAAIDGLLTIAAIHGGRLPKEYGEPGNSPMSIAVRAAYLALRAHLLGEDA